MLSCLSQKIFQPFSSILSNFHPVFGFFRRKMSASKVVLPRDAALRISPDSDTKSLTHALNEVLFTLRNVENIEHNWRSARAVAAHFAQDGFLSHPNNHVKALIAGCLTEMFRIFVGTSDDEALSQQEAVSNYGPFSDAQTLRNVLEFLIEQLERLLNRKNSDFEIGYHVLQLLASTRAYMLMFSLDDYSDLMENFVKLFFLVVSEAHKQSEKVLFLDILSGILGDEETTLTHHTLALLLNPLTRTIQRQNPASYGLAKELLKRISKAVEPCISPYFHQLMQGESFTEEVEMKGHVPELVLELFAISPQLVTSTLRHLDTQITSTVVDERISCLLLIDRLFTSSNFCECGNVERDLLVRYASGRLNDIDDKARTLAVRVGQHFVCSQKGSEDSSRLKDYITNLGKKLLDPAAMVRAEAIKAICMISRVALDQVTEATIHTLGERLLDKEPAVRDAAVTAVCDLFHHVLYPGNEPVVMSNEKLRQKLGPLLVTLLDDMGAIPEKLSEFKFLGKMLPADAGEYLFSGHLLYFYACCSEKGLNFFEDHLKRNHLIRQSLIELLSNENYQSDQKRLDFKNRLIVLLPTFKSGEKGLDGVLDLIHKDAKLRKLLLQFANLVGYEYGPKVDEIMQCFGTSGAQANEKRTIAHRLLDVIVPFRLNDRQCNNVYTRIFEVLNSYIKESTVLCPALAIPIGEEQLRSRASQLLATLGSLCAPVFAVTPRNSSVSFALHKPVRLWREAQPDVAINVYKFLANVAPLLTDHHQTVIEELNQNALETTETRHATAVTAKMAKYAVRILSKCSANSSSDLDRALEWAKDTLESSRKDYERKTAAVAALGELAVVYAPKPASPNGSFASPVTARDDFVSLMIQRVIKSVDFQKIDGDESLDSDELVARNQLPADVQLIIECIKCSGKYIRSISSLKQLDTQQRQFVKSFHEKMEEALVGNQLNSLDTNSREHLVLTCAFQLIKTRRHSAAHIDKKTNVLIPLLHVFPKLSLTEARDKYMSVLLDNIYSEHEPGRLLAAVASAAYPSDNKPLQFKASVHKPTLGGLKVLRKRVMRDGTKFALSVPELSILYLIHALAGDKECPVPSKLKQHIPWLEKQGSALYALIDVLVHENLQYSPGIIARLLQVIKQNRLAGFVKTSDVHSKAHMLCDFALTLLDKRVTNGSKQECVVPIHFPKDVVDVDMDPKKANEEVPPSVFTLPVSTSKRNDGTVAVFLGGQGPRESDAVRKSARKRAQRSRSSHAESESTEPDAASIRSESMDLD